MGIKQGEHGRLLHYHHIEALVCPETVIMLNKSPTPYMQDVSVIARASSFNERNLPGSNMEMPRQ